MGIENVPGGETEYFLVNFDKDGDEHPDQDSDTGRLSDRIVSELSTGNVTDVIVLCHGWKGDIPAARRQYGDWLAAAMRCPTDLASARDRLKGFKPLHIGAHWPSLPWGNEDRDAPAGALAASGIRGLIEDAAAKLADTPQAMDALRVVFDAAVQELSPDTLPTAVIDAYRRLFEEAGLLEQGPAAPPGNDVDRFDPEAIYQEARVLDEGQALSGGRVFGGLLWPLRQLSFWKMKARAREVGETGIHDMLHRLMATAPAVRFHLMGHSLGCIVASAAVNGPGGEARLPRPVSTLYLVQGALSHWAYCSQIPNIQKPGYFHDIVAAPRPRVCGPILVTSSRLDLANGKAYPLGASIGGGQALGSGKLPKYGALGTWGMNGPGFRASPVTMLGCEQGYGFRAGEVYNIDASNTINGQGNGGDAHNDIAKPEVAHAFWEGMICGC